MRRMGVSLDELAEDVIDQRRWMGARTRAGRCMDWRALLGDGTKSMTAMAAVSGVERWFGLDGVEKDILEYCGQNYRRLRSARGYVSIHLRTQEGMRLSVLCCEPSIDGAHVLSVKHQYDLDIQREALNDYTMKY